MKKVSRWWLLCSLEKQNVIAMLKWEENWDQRCQHQLVSCCLWRRGECRGSLPQSGQSWTQRLPSSQPLEEKWDFWIGTWLFMWAAICIPAARPQNRNASRTINLVLFVWKSRPRRRVGGQVKKVKTGALLPKTNLDVLSSVVVMSTRRELTPRRKTRSPPVRSWRHSNSRNSISRWFVRIAHLSNRTASYLELVEPEGIDHVDDVEKEVSSQAGQNQGLSGESARIGKESFNACRHNSDFWLKILAKKDLNCCEYHST